jgi:HlyD family secretion protein
MRNLGSKAFMLLVAAAIIGGLVFAFVPRPLQVDLVKVDRGTVRVTVDEDGKTRIREKYVVSAPLNGRILRISMDPGDKVEAGKTLLTMIEPRDPDLLDARSVAQAEARVKGAEATLRQVEPRLETARADQAHDEAELMRVRKAHETNAASRAELDDADFAYRQSSEEMRASRIAAEIASFELEQAKAALMRSRPHADENPAPKSAENSSNIPFPAPTSDGNAPAGADGASDPTDHNNGWNFPIYSPITGRVLRVLQESSAVVTPGTSLVELGDPSDLEVEIDVLSRDAVKIHPGNTVYLEHWGGVKPLVGRVRVVEPSGFTKISTLGVEEQRVWVIVDLVDPPEQRTTLGDGFRVEARIVIDEATNALRIPTSSLFRAGEDPAVFLVKDGVAHVQKVEVGRQNGIEAEITKGLTEGDEVVLHPSDQIEDGTKVKQR